jgi:methionine sulfoxide reductase heme-binding subunit
MERVPMSDVSAATAPRRPMFSGWPLFRLFAFGLTAMVAVLILQRGYNLDAVRVVVRTTAQTSLFFFCTAFAASSLHALVPSMATRWLLTNRRYFGVAFAYSHFLHALALYAFSRLDPALFAANADISMFIFGGLGYVFIALMTATSFDYTATLIGRRAWQVLHTVGAYDIWITFMVAEGKRAVYDTYYWPYVGALVAVMALRLLAGKAKRTRPA